MTPGPPGPDPFTALFRPSPEDTIVLLAFLAAFPGAFVGAIVGAIVGARRAAAIAEKSAMKAGPQRIAPPTNLNPEGAESTEQELARLRERIEELERATSDEAIKRKNGL
jgi:hypothetical protein